jgi:hypothetical protein
MMNWLVLLVLLFVLLLFLVVWLVCKLSWLNQRNKLLTKKVTDLDTNLKYCRTLLNSRSRDTTIAEDRARKNQDRWIKFRHDMIRLYALHEFTVVGSADAMERVIEWNSITVGDQAEWLQRGTEFVERNYGSLIG